MKKKNPKQHFAGRSFIVEANNGISKITLDVQIKSTKFHQQVLERSARQVKLIFVRALRDMRLELDELDAVCSSIDVLHGSIDEPRIKVARRGVSRENK